VSTGLAFEGGEAARNLAELLCCPCCQIGELDWDRELRCSHCATRYPTVGSIPLLVPDSARLRQHIEDLVGTFDERMRGGLLELLAALHGAPRRPRTRKRLEVLHEHLGQHHRRMLEIMARAGVMPAQGSASGAPRDGEDALVDYYPQLHRDWGWDGSENLEAREASDMVSQALGSRPVGKLLVLGAGACRLTQDIHHRHRAAVTVALDLNPLPFVVAARILRGESVDLYEFPPWPLDSERTFVDRRLKSPWPPAANLHLLFADGLNPPVRPGRFDTVLTPWFVDQVPPDMSVLFERLWQILPPGGSWINFGPLIYREEHTALPERYCVDEVLELVEAAGFRVEWSRFRRMTYMQSPASCQGRSETVLTFRAERLAARPRVRPREAPEWLADTALPVPRLAELERHRGSHPLFVTIAGLIDGERSVDGIARTLTERAPVSTANARSAVIAFLNSVFEGRQ
jgi:uncharacterized protein YbaR (Trm112 family)